ncbi:MAG TPA: dihydroorotate dehydrogenase electron transfer subunit, partial [Methylomirabilota bacterium]|nr:dihydroorotate dehydrogenase electron transfer subunit [Methylomirabilota bacterium]
GPHGLLHEVAELAAARGIRCEASLEGPMACAVGACRGCPVPLRDGVKGTGGGRYPAMCIEGPVMDATLVDWGRLP